MQLQAVGLKHLNELKSAIKLGYKSLFNLSYSERRLQLFSNSKGYRSLIITKLL